MITFPFTNIWRIKVRLIEKHYPMESGHEYEDSFQVAAKSMQEAKDYLGEQLSQYNPLFVEIAFVCEVHFDAHAPTFEVMTAVEEKK